MTDWLTVFGQKRLSPLKLGWFHLGADVASSVPSTGLPTDAIHVLNASASRPTFLMVGTIEPRKGQAQTLAAFTQLWEQHVDVNLIIVGKQGWMVEELIEAIHNHPECNRRLFWLDRISDEYLEKIYAAATCLIAASEGEGFGLPLIEAAQHKLPIIARDIPVFREVAGEHAYYFSGLAPLDLTNAVKDWLTLDKMANAPQSAPMPWLTWKESTQNLLDVMLGGQWYQQWMPDNINRFWGSDHRLYTAVGQRQGRDMTSTDRAGYLIYGPYLNMAAGNYQVTIHGALISDDLDGARMDVACNNGDLILGELALNESNNDSYLATLPISLRTTCTDLEIRIWVGVNTNLRISMIEIKPW
jgi:hypothetical protein